eukprot:Rhum_TRINITY_DN4027_c0_g1::Rhum_TRINITY_DN4027_c0_g1_i1::g.12767::m.12767
MPLGLAPLPRPASNPCRTQQGPPHVAARSLRASRAASAARPTNNAADAPSTQPAAAPPDLAAAAAAAAAAVAAEAVTAASAAEATGAEAGSQQEGEREGVVVNTSVVRHALYNARSQKRALEMFIEDGQENTGFDHLKYFAEALTRQNRGRSHLGVRYQTSDVAAALRRASENARITQAVNRSRNPTSVKRKDGGDPRGSLVERTLSISEGYRIPTETADAYSTASDEPSQAASERAADDEALMAESASAAPPQAEGDSSGRRCQRVNIARICHSVVNKGRSASSIKVLRGPLLPAEKASRLEDWSTRADPATRAATAFASVKAAAAAPAAASAAAAPSYAQLHEQQRQQAKHVEES